MMPLYRTRCSVSRCTAEPGNPRDPSALTRIRQRTASRYAASGARMNELVLRRATGRRLEKTDEDMNGHHGSSTARRAPPRMRKHLRRGGVHENLADTVTGMLFSGAL